MYLAPVDFPVKGEASQAQSWRVSRACFGSTGSTAGPHYTDPDQKQPTLPRAARPERLPAKPMSRAAFSPLHPEKTP